MNLQQLINRVRSLTRDFTNAVFREKDVIDYLNESIDRCTQVIDELRLMQHLVAKDDTPDYLPTKYHHLLSLYAAARLFSQDERFHQSATLMNEFELKLQSLNNDLQNGKEEIIDPVTDEVVGSSRKPEYVTNKYFNPIERDNDRW